MNLIPFDYDVYCLLGKPSIYCTWKYKRGENPAIQPAELSSSSYYWDEENKMARRNFGYDLAYSEKTVKEVIEFNTGQEVIDLQYWLKQP